jgi:hypothetical protein
MQTLFDFGPVIEGVDGELINAYVPAMISAN